MQEAYARISDRGKSISGNYSLKTGAWSSHDAIVAIELKQRTLLMSETTEKLQFSIGDSEEHKRRDQLMHT